MRKLVISVSAYTAALILSKYIISLDILPIIAVAVIVLSVAALFLKGETRTKSLFILLSAAVGFAWFYGYTQLTVLPAEALDGQTFETSLTAVDYTLRTDYGCKTEVVTTCENGSKIKTMLYVYNEASENIDLSPGDTVKAEFRFKLADEMYGEKSDNFFAKGVFLFAYPKNDPVIERTGNFSIKYIPRYISNALREQANLLYNDNTHALALAFAAGDNSEIYENVGLKRDLSESGIIHIASVSGMHIAFIVGFLMLFLGRNKRSGFIIIPVILFFMAVMGFSPSVVRAGLMQILILLSVFLNREADPLTSLMFALGVLLICNPFSISSIGLQLSFTSTLGIILITPRLNGYFVKLYSKKIKSRFWTKTVSALFASAATSLGAAVFTLPLTAAYFNSFSLISPLTNLFAAPVTSLAFILCLLSCAFGLIWLPLGKILAMVAWLPMKLIYFLASVFSKIPMASFYISNNAIIMWLVFVYILIFSALFFKFEFKHMVVSISVAAILLCIAEIVSIYRLDGEALTANVLDVGQGQCIVLTSDTATAVIDCGSQQGGAGEKAAEYLRSIGRNRIDIMILTHFHSDHANGISELSELMDISTLIMPEASAEDNDMLNEIKSFKSLSHTRFINVTADTDISMASCTFEIFAPLSVIKGDENENGLAIVCTSGDYDILVTGDMPYYMEQALVNAKELPDIEVFIAGHHGSASSSSLELLAETTPEIAVISVGYNGYGHPAKETLDRFRTLGITVMRTDISGSILLKSNTN